jgi:outer membrane assembly lipoprotein YfiO
MGLGAAIVLVLVAMDARAAAPVVSELRNGQWVDVAAPTTQVATDPTLDQIEALIKSHRYKSAMGRAVDWLKANPSSPARDRGLYLEAQALYGYGDRIKAFYYCDELMDEHPESRLFYPALSLQYKIADAYLLGYKQRWLGIPMFSGDDEAVEMLFRIQARSPGSPLAEQALLRTADYYYANEDYDFAGDAYGEYVRRYPRSPNVPRAELRQAYSYLAQFAGLHYDSTPVVNARAQLMQMVAEYPDLAQEEHLPDLLQRIDRTLAQKLYAQGDFYERTHQPRAAAYTYKYIMKNYAQTPAASQAQGRLNKLPQWALQTPTPGKPTDLSPSTRPAVDINAPGATTP